MPTCTWEDPAVNAYRACALCQYGRNGTHCAHPEELRNLDSGELRPVHVARSTFGTCGAEAKHLTFPGLQPLQPFARVLP